MRLRSAGSGHTDLQLVISEIKEMRQAARWFQNSQTSAAGDLLKWSLRGENRAIQETAAQLVELNMIWSEVKIKHMLKKTSHCAFHEIMFNLTIKCFREDLQQYIIPNKNPNCPSKFSLYLAARLCHGTIAIHAFQVKHAVSKLI